MEVAKQQRASLGSHSSLPSDEFEPDPIYREALDWIWSFSALPRSPADMATQRAVKLERMYALLERLGHPELRFPCVLVAGTKGKGSTVAMISACLSAAGYRTGRYTSPHLLNWRERTVINHTPISTSEVIDISREVRSAVDGMPSSLGPLTTFEVGTAITFVHFARQNTDLAVVEVGTGGRFDATNLVEPLVSVIAPISYDHTQTLGASLTSIAWHKAGVMRWGRPAVAAPQVEEARRIIESEARLNRAHLDEVGRDWRWSPLTSGIRVESAHADVLPLQLEVGLVGAHQNDNATTALAALYAVRDRFPIDAAVVAGALESVEWPGRLQIVGREPLVLLDGAHNAASAQVVVDALDHDFHFKRLRLIVGLTQGKDALGVLTALAPRADAVYLTRSTHERAAEPGELEQVVRTTTPGKEVHVYENCSSAMDAALSAAGSTDLVLVTGSLFLVGEALAWWHRWHP